MLRDGLILHPIPFQSVPVQVSQAGELIWRITLKRSEFEFLFRADQMS